LLGNPLNPITEPNIDPIIAQLVSVSPPCLIICLIIFVYIDDDYL